MTSIIQDTNKEVPGTNFEYNNYVQKQIDTISNSKLTDGNKNYIIETINNYKQKCIEGHLTSSLMINNISSIIEKYKEFN